MKGSFHGFTIQEKIGAGGMSTVYKGVHSTLGYPVAIKLLHVELSEDDRFIARFEREARLAASISNGNIASVIDFVYPTTGTSSLWSMSTARTSGRRWTRWTPDLIESRALPVEIVLALIESVANGLKAAHDCGIVHRDIKPSNLMLRRDGEVKIVDFGLARDVKDIGAYSAGDLTHTGTVLGTAAYMSPEQARGEKNLGHQTDIFSLGITCYEMLTGEKPFKGDSLSEIQGQISRSAAPRLTRESCPLLTGEIIDLVGRMLAHNVEKRFQSMDQVLRVIDVCWDNFDIIGFAKHRRTHLAQFARDPRAFALELRQKDIKAYLNRGRDFETMGLEKIADAISAFESVLSLDPDNRKAEIACHTSAQGATGKIGYGFANGRRTRRRRTQLYPVSPQPSESPVSRPLTTRMKAWAAFRNTTRRVRYLSAATASIALRRSSRCFSGNPTRRRTYRLRLRPSVRNRGPTRYLKP